MPSLCPRCGKSVPHGSARCTHCDAVLPSEVMGGGPTSAPGVGGRWEVLEALEPLGTQKVYRVRNRTTDDEFALRMLPLAVASEEEAKDRIRSLILRGKDLIGEPGILAVVGFEVEDRTPYFISEVFRGACLLDRMKKERTLPPEDVRRVGLGVATALASAHRKGVFHGELRPQCVLVGADGEVRVTDFGVGRVVSEISAKSMGGGAAGPSGPARIPFYKSPEFAKTDLPDARSDLYALGCLLFEALTGEKRFPDAYRDVLKEPKAGVPFPDPCASVPAMDPALREVVRKLLAPAAADRFEDAVKVQAALKGEPFPSAAVLAAGAPPPPPAAAAARPAGKAPSPPSPRAPSPPPPPPPAPPPSPGRKPATPAAPPAEDSAEEAAREPRKPLPRGGIAVAVVVVALLGAAGWMIQQGNLFASFRAPVEEPPPPPPPPADAPPALPSLPPPPTQDAAGRKLPDRVVLAGGRIRSLVDGAELVVVPEGDFVMGSEDGGPDESPQVRRILSPFLIDRHEVTVGQFRRFCAASGRKLPAQPAGRSDSHPVVRVTWTDANAYARWAGRRLPTEAEWEKAARGADARTYPWGAEDGADRRNGPGEGAERGTLSPAGSFPAGASPFGALDMAGSVWEWCADWYAADSYLTGASRDPKGPSGGAERVVRGGSFLLGGASLRTSFRNHLDPAATWDDIGFRCAADLR